MSFGIGIPFVPYVKLKNAIFTPLTSFTKIVSWSFFDLNVPVCARPAASKKSIVLSIPVYPLSIQWLFAVETTSNPVSFKFFAKISGVLNVGYPLYPRFAPERVVSKFPTVISASSMYCFISVK